MANFTPERWAFEITHLLKTVMGNDRFPVDIPIIAKEYTANKWPDDPIISIKADDLPNFDGGLFKAPSGRKGWKIIYNNAMVSLGRINFTLAHEFGHYLLHRMAYPKGFNCSQMQVAWDSEYGQIEYQANVFAANLLMPLDDFRQQIPEQAKVDLDMISHCANRYCVSLIAAVLRWLHYTSKRAILVVSRDGYILWSRSSTPAFKSRAYFNTRSSPIEIPESSLAAKQDLLVNGRAGIHHDAGIWLGEPTREMTIFSEQYDFVITLLLLEDAQPFAIDEAEPELDIYDKMMSSAHRREW